MQIEESKKEINKIYREEIIEMLRLYLGDLKFETIVSSLKLILDYIATKDISYSIKSALFYMIFITIFRRTYLIILNDNLLNKERINKLHLYNNLRKELKNNINRFENIEAEQLEDEIKKLLTLRYN